MSRTRHGVRLTVALPVFNAGKHLRLAVLSIAHQTFRDWELLIIDDGSTDGALDDIADLYDNRVHIVRDGLNRGLAVRLNEALDMARGEFFARMDADDVSYPERFAHQLMALEADSSLDVLATRAITINDDNQLSGMFPFARTHRDICKQPWRGFHFLHPSWMGRIEWFRRHRYGEPAAYLSEDQELLLRTYRESKFETLDEILIAYRLKSRIDWGRLTKTRNAVFAFQEQQFIHSRQWLYLLLAALSFGAKLGRDLFNRVSRGTFYPVQTVVDSASGHEWNEILGGLLNGKVENAR